MLHSNEGLNMSGKGKKKFNAVGPEDIAVLNVKELEAFLKIDENDLLKRLLGLIPYVRIQSKYAS